MQRIERSLVFSPSDLHKFVECEHLTALQVLASDGLVETPERDDAALELLREKGLEHERVWLKRLRDEGRAVTAIEVAGNWSAAALATEAAMREGAPVIYQGVLRSGNWRGVADFLIRVDRPTRLGAWGYEAWDTKLGRHGKPSYILQLSFYCQEIARIQGCAPERMHVVLGTTETASFVPSEFAAYFRRLQRRLADFTDSRVNTYPYPIGHCAFCDFDHRCKEQWTKDDHLSQIAYIRRDQVRKLEDAGIRTLDSASRVQPPIHIRMSESTQQEIVRQARLQREARDTGIHRYELLAPGMEKGFSLLPEPDPGDLFFDIEGYPYFESSAGLEYLFGTVWTERGKPKFRALWAENRATERRMFEQFIDFVRARLRARPHLHIYHYANYEVRALKELMQRYGTREEELDDLLRREVFVDLFRVTRQTLRISYENYSLKSMRKFFMPEAGQGEVAAGDESIVEFAKWLESRDPRILNAIERYNEEDCVSTLRLRDWLLERRQEAESLFQCTIPWRASGDAADNPIVSVVDPHEALRAKLETEKERVGGRDLADLMSDLLAYHKREAKPAWWAYFDRLDSSADELMENAEAIARLMPVAGAAPRHDANSTVHLLSYPEQEHKLAPQLDVVDQRTGKAAGILWSLDSVALRLELRRGPTLAGVPLPLAIVAGKPIPTDVQSAAVQRVVSDIAQQGLDRTRYGAAAALLSRAAPRFSGMRPGVPIQTLDLARQQRLVENMDGSYLFVQGPPGSGKTFTGARLVTHLLARGARIGVAANSHKAIHNLLTEIENIADERNLEFSGLKKVGRGEDTYFDGQQIDNTASNEACEDRSVRLVAGTSWLFSRQQMEMSLDYLFVDEAGQVALADAIAMATCAKNVVLLGDPQQLPHVSQGVHPGGSGASVLEHLLGGAATVSETHGLFLAESWRMHPDVCGFISEVSYDGRLRSAPGRERQHIASNGLSGSGLRFISVDHAGNAQQSVEEAQAVAAEVGKLLAGGTFTNVQGQIAPLKPADILVVAPYNMQVRCLREHLPADVEVGTVDKFQGREAAVVFFSMATSSGANVPRNLEFLFSRNRLNVAISRAKCLAVLVASPRLLDVSCRTVDQMRLVNGLCRFVEIARAPEVVLV